MRKAKAKAENRERRIDEALKETFPASDPPSYVGGVKKDQGIKRDQRGQEQPTDKERARGSDETKR
jgi:hypothetical protein